MNDQTGFDPKRRLCPDGTCTGVIGLDGTCGDCGRTAGGGNGGGGGRAFSAVSDVSNVSDVKDVSGVTREGGPDRDGDGDGSRAVTAAPAAQGNAGSGFDPNRRLCDDGACVGIVGPGGACTVCGRVAG